MFTQYITGFIVINVLKTKTNIYICVYIQGVMSIAVVQICHFVKKQLNDIDKIGRPPL